MKLSAAVNPLLQHGSEASHNRTSATLNKAHQNTKRTIISAANIFRAAIPIIMSFGVQHYNTPSLQLTNGKSVSETTVSIDAQLPPSIHLRFSAAHLHAHYDDLIYTS